MPAHKPASHVRSSEGIIGAIQQKPAWLVPIFGAFIILLLLTILIVAPSNTSQQSTEFEEENTISQSSPAPSENSIESIEYLNNKLGFSLRFPKSWKDKYTITESADSVVVEYSGGDQKAELFVIEPIPEESWRELKNKPYLLSSRKGIVFGYTTPSENPFNASDSAGSIVFREYGLFLREVPSVVQTFEFSK